MKVVFLDRATFNIGLEAPQGNFVCHERTAPSEVRARLADADIAIINKVVLDRTTLAQLPKLKLIQITATGTNNVDLDAAREFGIRVNNVENYSFISVPEHTLMLMLMSLRAGVHHHQLATDGTWQATSQFCLIDVPILDLYGKTVGIIGAGNIGRRVGELVSAFGAKPLFAERRGARAIRAEYTAFDDVLAHANIISLHCPLTEHTHHLIDDATLASCHRRPIIINAARGGVVDSHAIIRALDSGQISGYATDVLLVEPPPSDEPLLHHKHPRLILTPHNAWASEHAQRTLWQTAKAQINAFIASHAL